ncbi:hypothetical protein [Streptomyces glaucescens]|uniref:hypothetical protein n=1 Tax=Streptomyces glaucescens TaxID=1907 RepID=UPI0006948F66|nr:hypothetical protein [Streptomyces glaucescens]
MTKHEAELVAMLRELDDPGCLEQPRDYDRGKVGALFNGLVARLEDDFATQCVSERDTQDSSEYGRVTVPADATARGTRIVVCVSKFGSLALVCAENPGAFLGTGEAQAEGELDAADLDNVCGTLADLGYVIVPEELLECDYAGPSQLPWHVQRPTWWHRFFGIF